MIRRVSKNLVAGESHNALEYVLEHIGVTWPIMEREQLYQSVVQAMFPEDHVLYVWEGVNLTPNTVGGEPYYPDTVSLKDPPGIWFRNLRLLQICKKLDLVGTIRVTLNLASCVVGEVYFKLKALKKVIGKEMIPSNYVSRMKKPRMMTSHARIERDKLVNQWRP